VLVMNEAVIPVVYDGVSTMMQDPYTAYYYTQRTGSNTRASCCYEHQLPTAQ
jgi:hypothetical protein